MMYIGSFEEKIPQFFVWRHQYTIFIYTYSMHEYVWIVHCVNEYVWIVYSYPILLTCVYESCS